MANNTALQRRYLIGIRVFLEIIKRNYVYNNRERTICKDK